VWLPEPNKPKAKEKCCESDTELFYTFHRGWWGKKERSLQDLNLRGQCPSDFKSDALTTRPNEQYFRILHFLSQFNIYTLQKNHCLDSLQTRRNLHDNGYLLKILSTRQNSTGANHNNALFGCLKMPPTPVGLQPFFLPIIDKFNFFGCFWALIF
jgi:hypothetical protein